MPLVPHTQTLIELPVSDRLVADTIIKQKARFVSLHHLQTPEGVCSCRVLVDVSLYASDGGAFGVQLTGAGLMNYQRELVADNNTIVDAQTGEILLIRGLQVEEADWVAAAEGHEQAVMFQGDFFEMLREQAPVQIGDMIRQHIAAADAMGKFSA